jgi:ankyrin repeat protein
LLDADSATPLHHAVAKRAALPTVSAVLAAFPAAVTLPSSMRLTKDMSPANDEQLSMQQQATAFSTDETRGFTPLHWAGLIGEPGTTALLLGGSGEHGKAGAAVPCAKGRVALHTTAAYGADAASLKLLIEAYPEGLKHVDSTGSLPLHHAAAYGAPLETLATISAEHPAGKIYGGAGRPSYI